LPAELMGEVRERFLREARSAGRLNHPNIVTIFDVGEQDGVAYIAMEVLEGRSLQQMLREPRLRVDPHPLAGLPRGHGEQHHGERRAGGPAHGRAGRRARASAAASSSATAATARCSRPAVAPCPRPNTAW